MGVGDDVGVGDGWRVSWTGESRNGILDAGEISYKGLAMQRAGHAELLTVSMVTEIQKPCWGGLSSGTQERQQQLFRPARVCGSITWCIGMRGSRAKELGVCILKSSCIGSNPSCVT